MIFSVQTDNFEMLKPAVKSECDKVRFGSEFCEWKIPSLSILKRAYKLVSSGEKDFAYITPKVSESSLKKIRKQLDFLRDKEKIDVIVNDLGVLNILAQYPELTPYLGRQIVYIPARCPWLEMRPFFMKMAMRNVEETYSQTSLNYAPTIKFFQELGVQGADLDWIPRCFPYFDFLTKMGLNISVHLYLIPVTITRKCHTARFVGEKNPRACSKPCNTKAYLLKQEDIELKLFLHGNVVFRFIKPSRNDLEVLLKSNVTELIIGMNPITKISNQQKIDKLIHGLKSAI